MSTFEEWMLDQFETEELEDMVNNGVSGGFSGLIYYEETRKLYKEFQEEIWDNLAEDAEDAGTSIMEFIGSFKIQPSTSATFENLLVWYLAEKYAHKILTEIDDLISPIDEQ